MTWLLVYIVLSNDGIDVGQLGSYSTMTECFEAREALVLEVGDLNTGLFKVNQQAICIRTNVGF